MKISVVITCRNYGKYLEECVKSVVAQTYQNVEIIIVDDASDDGTTRDVVIDQTKYVNHIVYNKYRKGLAESSNIGIQKASGEYVLRLDADDLLHKECLQIMASYGTDIVFSDYKDSEGTVVQTWPPMGSCVLFRRALWEKAGGFNIDLHHQEDLDLLLRLKGEVKKVDLPLWFYRRHEGQMSRAHNEKMAIRKELLGHKDVLTVIPAKSISRGLPRKNFLKVDDTPLLKKAIHMVKASGIVTHLAIVTDSEELCGIALGEGCRVIDEPKELLGTDINTIHVLEYAIDKIGKSFDVVCTVQITSPFTPPEAFAEAVRRVSEGPWTSATPVYELGKHPWRAYWLADNGKLTPIFEEAEKYQQRQDRPPAYAFSGGFYVRQAGLIKAWDGTGFALGSFPYGVLVKRKEGIDIDTEEDLIGVDYVPNS